MNATVRSHATSPAPGYDEAVDADGSPRPPYERAMAVFDGLEVGELSRRRRRAAAIEEAEGITFRVTGEDEAQVFPIDPFPRIITAETWQMLSRGLEQRARALNAFLDDVYGPRRIIDAGIIDAADVERSPGYVAEGRLQAPGQVRAHVCGMDLVCTDDGRWLVLEDNLRVPSGLVFSHVLREITTQVYPDVAQSYVMHDPHEAFAMLRETLLAAAPAHHCGSSEPRLALVSSGSTDSAWFEHRTIADLVGIPVCTPDQLLLVDGHLHHRDADGATHALDVVYARIEKDQLFSARGADGVVLGPGLEQAMTTGHLAIANAFGNGVGDDKAIYAYVPDMIRFYLGEEPLLEQVPTDLCHDAATLDAVIARLGERVVKPVDGYGGAGITIGPECTKDELAQRAHELRAHPERFIAQDVVRLSTLPTYDTDGRSAGSDGPDGGTQAGESRHGETVMSRRHVDLRAFVHVRPASRTADAAESAGRQRAAETGDARTQQAVSAHDLTAHTVPAALTRTAPPGSLVVNSSRGGGGKDTWILRETLLSDPVAS